MDAIRENMEILKIGHWASGIGHWATIKACPNSPHPTPYTLAIAQCPIPDAHATV
ncbi:MAG: hypothetical protein F6J93_38365 [Oscillatoria sp. SIO1A7]|nr:hypothetical protein [Oscillatoria sp. SIO1A7]